MMYVLTFLALVAAPVWADDNPADTMSQAVMDATGIQAGLDAIADAIGEDGDD